MNRLPNFLYVGPDKAGSSWLHESLLRHHDVHLSPAKDLYFFDRYYDRGPAWYAEQFRDARAEEVVGEVCQDYLFHPDAAARIRSTLGPSVRFMVSLRDPVERAWSSYLYAHKHGLWTEPFGVALERHPELLGHGRYATGLERFLRLYPREQVHVAVFDDLVADPQGFLDAVTDFLGVDPLPLSDKEREATLPAAQARSVRVAHAVRRSADWLREHDGARLVGRVKRSPFVHRALYRPIDRASLRPTAAEVAVVREELAGEVDRLEDLFGLGLRAAWGWDTAVPKMRDIGPATPVRGGSRGPLDRTRGPFGAIGGLPERSPQPQPGPQTR